MARVEDEHDAHGPRADVMLGRVVRDRARDLAADDAARRDDHLGVVLSRACLSSSQCLTVLPQPLTLPFRGTYCSGVLDEPVSAGLGEPG